MKKEYATFQNKKYIVQKLIKEIFTGFIYLCFGFFVRNLKIFKVIVQRFQRGFGFLVLNSEKCCCNDVVCRYFVLSLFCVVISLFVICFHRCWGVLKGVCHLYLHLRRLRRCLLFNVSFWLLGCCGVCLCHLRCLSMWGLCDVGGVVSAVCIIF